MNYKLNNQIKLSILLITWLIISTPLRADDHQYSDVTAMSDGTIEAAQLTVCTLNPGKTLDDVSEILPSIREVHREIELDAFYGLMTPLFVNPKTTIDFGPDSGVSYEAKVIVRNLSSGGGGRGVLNDPL